MVYYVLAWHEGKFEIYHLNSYESPDEYVGVKCRIRFESEEDAQKVIDWILQVLGTRALGV